MPLDATLPLAPVDADAGRIDALRRAPGGAARRQAATELEVMFLTQLLQAMRRTVPENDFLPRSPERSVYEGAFDRTVATAVAAHDPLGFVHALGADAGPGLALKSPATPADTVAGHYDQGRDSRPS